MAVNVRELVALINGVLPPGVLRLVQDETAKAKARMRAHFVPYPGGDFPTHPLEKLFSRSGRLKFAIRAETHQDTPSQVTAKFRIDESDPVANMIAHVQEFGQPSIRPVFADKLAIPTGPQLDSRGVSRFGSLRGNLAKRLFDFVVRPGAILGRPKGSPTTALVRHFLRVTGVSVPARPFMGPEGRVMATTLASRLGGVLVGA